MPNLKKSNIKALYITDKLKESFSTLLEYPCTVVEAPMGYGKTTAVNEALSYIEAVAIWQKIYDRSVAEFWSGFCHAVSKIDEECASNLKKIGIPSDSLMLREAMVLIENMNIVEETFLIIDDYHLVKSEEVDAFLEIFIKNLPELLHLIIITRTAFVENSMELQLKGIVNHIGTRMLEFDVDDITNYYRLWGIVISEEDQAELYRRSEGWISALYLFAVNYKLHGSFVFTHNFQELVYKTVYEPLTFEMKAFLVNICLFDGFNLEQARYMWQKNNAKKLLEQLLNSNAFISLDQASGNYAFHNIFLACVREQFMKQSEVVKIEIYKRMGDLYYHANACRHAMESYYKASDFDGILTALEKDRGKSIFSEQKDMLIKYYKECPKNIKLQHPIAILVYAITVIAAFNEEKLYEEACSEFLISLDHNKLSVDERNQLLGEYEMLRGFAEFNDIRKMREHNFKAYKLLKATSKSMDTDNSWTLGSPSVLYLYYRVPGELQDLVKYLLESTNYYAMITDGHGIGFHYVFEAEWYYLMGDFESAKIAAHKAIPLARSKKQLDIVLCSFFLQARIALAEGDFPKSKILISQMRDEIKQSHAYSLIYTIELCDVYLHACLEQVEKLPQWVEEGEYRKKMFFPSLAFANIVCGKVLISKGEAIKLLGVSEQFLVQASAFPNALAIIYTYIYKSVANQILNRYDAAVADLRQAMNMAMADNLLMPFVENAKGLINVLKDLQQKTAYGEFINKILIFYGNYQKSFNQIINKHFSTKKNKLRLTEREKQIALLVIKGLTNKEIGKTLFISPDTVKTELKNIFSKFNINSRVLITKEMLE